MNITERFFTFTWLFLCLFYISLISESGAEVRIFDVGELCKANRTVNLRNYNNGILKAEVNEPVDCELLLGERIVYSVVISLYTFDLQPTDILVFRDNYGTELSLSGSGKYHAEERSFFFEGPLRIHFATNITSWFKELKFQFTFTESHGFECESEEFECNNKQCIPSLLRCNDHNNCGDGSDERNCSDVCRSDEFRCDNRKCIPRYKVCDSINDCGDFSDEKNCYPLCSREEFRCDNKKCISMNRVCDYNDDCGDFSDEKNCDHSCASYEFICKNGRCMDSYKVCNGNNDCGDWSDEANCNRKCLSSEFQCLNRKCIPKFFVCDKQNDCGDMSDEKNCGSTKEIKKPEYGETTAERVSSILVNVVFIVVVVLVIALSIWFCVAMVKRAKKKKANTKSSEEEQPAPSSIIGRMRQSFRSHGQPTAPPLEIASSTESDHPEWQETPSIMSRIRQSFRSNRQPTAQAPNANVENPPIYPHLPPAEGTDNPEFKAEE